MSNFKCLSQLVALLVVSVLQIAISAEAIAQHRRPVVTASLGVIRNYDASATGTHHSVYPEVQLNARLFALLPRSLEIDGSVYAGGFLEANKPLSEHQCGPQEPDSNGCWESFHRGLVLGSRINLILTKAPANFALFAGLSHYYKWTIENAFYYEGNVTERTTQLQTFQAVETGFRLHIPISSRFMAGGAVQVYTRLSAPRYSVKRRAAYMLGMSYRVK